MPARLPYAARVPALVAGIAAAALLARGCARGAQGGERAPAAAGDPRVLIAFMPIPDRVPRGADDAPSRSSPTARSSTGSTRASSSRSASAAPPRASTTRSRRCSTSRRARASRCRRYTPKRPPELRLYVGRERRRRCSQGWLDEVERARRGARRPVPGLLAGSIPGGAAYVGVGGRSPARGDRRRRPRRPHRRRLARRSATSSRRACGAQLRRSRSSSPAFRPRSRATPRSTR